MLTLVLISKLLLTANPNAPSTLNVELKPKGSELLVDGKKSGKMGDKPIILKLKSGKHLLRVVYKGDAHEEEIVLKGGEQTKWQWEFEGAEPTPDPTTPKME